MSSSKRVKKFEKLFRSKRLFLQCNANVVGGDLPVSWSKNYIGVHPGVLPCKRVKQRLVSYCMYESSSAAHVSSICICKKAPRSLRSIRSHQSWFFRLCPIVAVDEMNQD